MKGKQHEYATHASCIALSDHSQASFFFNLVTGTKKQLNAHKSTKVLIQKWAHINDNQGLSKIH